MATDPATAVQFNEALISYAEEQVDELTQRMRGDQMQGAQDSYADAEAKLLAAQRQLVTLQEGMSVISSEQEMQLITGQLAQLETQMTTERLSLEQMRLNPEPNKARMAPIEQRIVALQVQIDGLRARLTEGTADVQSIAKIRGELLIAEAETRRRELLLTQAVEAMETARVEANRQTRYLSVSVHPIAPDKPAYPRAFENTLVALLIFAGIYLLLAMTVDILREQVSG
jgi:capsular polysaccharide transport system permease protein